MRLRGRSSSVSRVTEHLEERLPLTTTLPVLAFSAPEYVSLGVPAEAQITAAAKGDLDQDGTQEIVIAGIEPVATDSDASSTLPFLRVLRAMSGYDFSQSSLLVRDEVTSIRLLDFDLNGSVDILAASSTGHVDVWTVGSNDTNPSVPRQERRFVFEGDVVAAEDVNQDGLPDLFARHEHEILVYLGEQNGPSPIPIRYGGGSPTQSGPGLELADFDGDGDLDVITVCVLQCEHVDQVMVRLNDGAGGFAETKGLFPTGGRAVDAMNWIGADEGFFVAFGDATRANLTSDVLHFLYAAGNTLEEAQSFPVSGRVEDLMVADANDDDSPDLFIRTAARSTQSDLVLVQTAEGYAPAISVPPVDADMFLDLSSGGKLQYLDTKRGRLVSREVDSSPALADHLIRYDVDIRSREAAILDLNQDALVDAVAPGDHGIEFQFGMDSGKFQAASLDLNFLESFRIFTGEFDESLGHDVVVVGNAVASGDTHVLRIDVSTEAPFIADTFIAEPGIVLDAADLDADGLTDFVLRSDFHADQAKSFVLLNRGSAWVASVLSTTSGTIAVEDFDGDGTLEPYVFDDPIRIFRYDADAFHAWGRVPKGTARAAVIDFNGDGQKDFLSIHKNSNAGTWLTVFENNGDGTWRDWQPIRADNHVLMDFNADGLMDIVSPRKFFLNRGDGTWQESDVLQSDHPVWAEQNRYVDVNGDNLIDNIKTISSSGLTTVHQLQPDLSWSVSQPVLVDAPEFSVIDINGDTQADLIEYGPGGLAIRTFEGDHWATESQVIEGVLDYDLFDSNGDGRTDLLVVRDSGAAVFIQSEQGRFASLEPLVEGDSSLRDVDGDGITDVVLGARSARSNLVMLGDGSGFTEPQIVSPFSAGVTLAEGQIRAVDDRFEVETYSVPLDLSSQDADAFPNQTTDIDGDGDDDFMLLHPTGLVVLFGVGRGDFDGDGQLDQRDLELLQSALAERPADSSRFDLNGDGILTTQDARTWIEEVAGFQAGDADMDGDVDFSDLVVFLLYFGRSDATWSMGDFDGDGTVSFPDFLMQSREGSDL